MKTKFSLTFSLLVFSIYSFAQSGLLGSYPFNGNANDTSGNGNNGVVNGAIPTTDRFGNPNSAYLFNGINSFIDLGNSYSYSSHSFSCWARRDSATGNVLISKINNGPYDLQNSEFGINALTIGTGTNWDGVYSTNSQVDYSQWSCYIATYNSTTNTAKIYVNGVVDSMVVGGYSDVVNTPIYVGARPFWNGTNGPSFFFKGAIDEVKIYNQVLTQQEIDSLCPILTAIKSNEKGMKLRIFPNPLSTQTTIQTDYDLNDATLSIFNSVGQQVIEVKNITGKTITILRENLVNGVYFIRLTQDNKEISKEKLIIIND